MSRHCPWPRVTLKTPPLTYGLHDPTLSRERRVNLPFGVRRGLSKCCLFPADFGFEPVAV